MFSGRSTVTVSPSTVSDARKMSVSGGFAVDARGGCRENAIAAHATIDAQRMQVRIAAHYISDARPGHPEDVAHHELLECRSHQQPDAGEEEQARRHEHRADAPADQHEREEQLDAES